jgi:hypothetical protein
MSGDYVGIIFSDSALRIAEVIWGHVLWQVGLHVGGLISNGGGVVCGVSLKCRAIKQSRPPGQPKTHLERKQILCCPSPLDPALTKDYVLHVYNPDMK